MQRNVSGCKTKTSCERSREHPTTFYIPTTVEETNRFVSLGGRRVEAIITFRTYYLATYIYEIIVIGRRQGEAEIKKM